MFLFYVDESGQREYNEKNSRHFVLGAVAISETDWRTVNQQINALKIEVFDDRRVEFKSVALRNQEKQRKRYLEPYGVSLAQLTVAIERLYEIVDAAPLILFAVIVDKRQMTAKYAVAESPTSYAYELLVERFERFLSRQMVEHSGIVIHDLIQEVPGASKSYQREIIKQHEKFLHEGKTSLAPIRRIVEGVHFVETDQSNFLQVADLVAYNIYRQFTEHLREWDDLASVDEKQAFDQLPTYPYFKRLLPKFDRGSNGGLRGCGIESAKRLKTESSSFR